MALVRACHRCERRPGIIVRHLANVEDAFPWRVVEEVSWLCQSCRSDAVAESAMAEQRGTGLYDALHFHNEFLILGEGDML